ncbi:MAG TPA: polyphenol oxidase family protein [Ktedonobacterales bacterium]|nr:polyphenol oxidase family protein [Ktedonobacterales bacterium]
MFEQTTDHTEYFEFEALSGYPQVAHGVFTRRRGFSGSPYAGLNGSVTTGDDVEAVLRNRRAVAKAIGLPLIWAKPVHGTDVVFVDSAFAAGAPGDAASTKRLHERLRVIEADAMVTDVPGLALCWSFGDCAPVLLYDPRHKAVALVHSGWRGAAGGITLRAIAAMGERYGTQPAELIVGIGPAIGACCYEVRENVVAAFQADPLVRETVVLDERVPEGETLPHHFLDVRRSTYNQALAAGVRSEHLEDSDICTGCRTDLFYSHRCEPWPSGRFMVAIGLRPE